MSERGKIRRYILIIEKINQIGYTSRKDIIEHLNQHDFNISSRTLDRDFDDLRNEFGVNIQYSRTTNNYTIETDSEIKLDTFFQFLKLANTAELIAESLKNKKQMLDYIAFDSNSDFEGIKHLTPIFEAIKTQKIIEFEHTNFHTEKVKSYKLKPYLLKEYQNRWYVIGLIDDSKEFRTFGIDRIEKLTISKHKFKRDKKLNPKEKFDDIIGLVYSISEPQIITLSFTPTQGKYIKSLPLHYTQTVEIDNEKELRISIRVAPNYELEQEILKHGESVTVLKPEWLANKIKTRLQEMLKNYC